jgi:uracil-DNA glycosylase family 4
MTTEFPTNPDPEQCKIAFVGSAGSLDDADSRLLNVMLRRANIDRADCLVTSIFHDKPEDDDAGPWLKDVNLFAAASERLNEELMYVNPNVIVPMGSLALQAFTGHAKISRFRGSIIEASRILPGAKLVPTIHPATIRKTWKLLVLAVSDLIKAAYEGDRGPDIIYPKVKLLLKPTISEVEAFLERCEAAELLSVDIETGWGMITCIGFAPNINEAICVPFVDLTKPNKSYWKDPADEVRAWKAVYRIMSSPVAKLGQNFTYDAFWLHEYGIPSMNYLHDTRLMHHALYPELPKDLASMAGSYTDLPSWKYWGAHGEEKRDS